MRFRREASLVGVLVAKALEICKYQEGTVRIQVKLTILAL